MRFSSFTLAGPKGSNEDAFLAPIELRGTYFFAVADGVGGSRNGGEASKLAVREAERIFRSSPSMPMRDIFGNIYAAFRNDAMRTSGASTTLSMVRIHEGIAQVGHVGDSRIYHLRGNGILSRTQDQTEIAELVREGIFSKQEAKHYRRRNVLTSAMSEKGQFTIFENEFAVQSGDVIIACTDGVYSLIDKQEMRDINIRCQNSDELTSSIKQLVETRGAIDDSTVVIFKVS